MQEWSKVFGSVQEEMEKCQVSLKTAQLRVTKIAVPAWTVDIA